MDRYTFRGEMEPTYHKSQARPHHQARPALQVRPHLPPWHDLGPKCFLPYVHNLDEEN
jgi:hypothetical protein